MFGLLRGIGAVTWFLGWSLILGVMPAWAQTAALLPNAKQTFLDQNGDPLSNGTVFLAVPNTNTPKTTWQDSGETTPNQNPVPLDAAGRAIIYGQGNYQQTVKDSAGNQQWSALTTAYGSSIPSGGSGTDTAPVGTVMPWAGFSLPINWLYAGGQAVSRTTYAQLMTAITIINATVSCVNTSTTLSGFADTSQMAVGEPIEATCIPPGTTIATITSSTSITTSVAATLTTTVTATVFPWGNGNGGTTFNVPDLRGRTFAGADALGGTAASRLTSTYYGSAASAPAVAGGAQSHTASTTLAQANLPNVNFNVSGISLNDPGHTHLAFTTPNIGAAPAAGVIGQGGSVAQQTMTTNTTGITINATAGVQGTAASGGSGTAAVSAAFSTVPPTITVNYIVKALPNTTGAGGVVSFGGMIGDIVCASSLTCAPIGSPAVNTVGCTIATLVQLGCVIPDGTIVTVSGAGAITVAKASAAAFGVVEVDNATILATAGVINCATSTASQLGCAKPDNTTITASGGVYSATFTPSSTNTLTNKTITSSTNLLGGVTAAFGSDAAGDTYFNSGVANAIQRLAVGSNGQCYVVTSGKPAWQSCGSGTVIITSGTTPTSGFTNNDLIASVSSATTDTGIAYTNVATLSGAQTISGNKTFSGQNIISGGLGTISSGQGSWGADATNGLSLEGIGATNDLRLINFSAGTVCVNPHNTTTLNCTGLQVSGAAVSTAAGANPTALAGPVVVNGSAPTFMRSDAAPAVQGATNSQKGLAQADGTSITASLGVFSTVINKATQQIFTSGSGTYTTPTSPAATYIEVYYCGGGGGGGADGTSPGAGTSGGNTTFGSSFLTGNGGGPGNNLGSAGTGGTSTGGDINITGQTPNSSSALGVASLGTPGGNPGFGFGTGGGGGNNAPGAGAAGTGFCSGGGGAGFGSSAAFGSGGGGGGAGYKLIVSPNATYAYSVGTAGAGGTAGGSGAAGGNGTGGLIWVKEHYGD